MTTKKNKTILATDDPELADLLIRALEGKFKGASFIIGRNRASGEYVIQTGIGKNDPADLIMYAEGFCDGLDFSGDGDAGDMGEDFEDEIEVIETRSGKKAGSYKR